jgi:hypothetical protein
MNTLAFGSMMRMNETGFGCFAQRVGLSMGPAVLGGRKTIHSNNSGRYGRENVLDTGVPRISSPFEIRRANRDQQVTERRHWLGIVTRSLFVV